MSQGHLVLVDKLISTKIPIPILIDGVLKSKTA